jgi:uncharacterized protein (TIGR04255 family)
VNIDQPMTAPKHLRNAPIKEAIIDFGVRANPSFDPKSLPSLKERLSPEFASIYEGRNIEAGFTFSVSSASEPVWHDLGVQSIQARSADQKEVAQFRIDGFTFNRLAPYTSWDDILPRALRSWNLYTEFCRPEAVVRLAVRNINHILIPRSVPDLREYFTKPPSGPPGIAGVMNGFFSTVILDDAKTSCSLKVTQASQAELDSESVTTILDIEAFVARDYQVDNQQILQSLESLHDLKNRAFFNSLTDRVLRKYE